MLVSKVNGVDYDDLEIEILSIDKGPLGPGTVNTVMVQCYGRYESGGLRNRILIGSSTAVSARRYGPTYFFTRVPGWELGLANDSAVALAVFQTLTRVYNYASSHEN